MQKLQQIKMDEEIQKITPIYSSKRRDENEYYSNSYYSCSFKLFLVRLMLFAMFSGMGNPQIAFHTEVTVSEKEIRTLPTQIHRTIVKKSAIVSSM